MQTLFLGSEGLTPYGGTINLEGVLWLSCRRCTTQFVESVEKIDDMGIGWQQLLIVAVILVLLFGAKRLPELMRNLGRSATEFKKGMNETMDDNEKLSE